LEHGAHLATGDEVAMALAHKRATSGDWRQPVPAISINQRRALEDLAQQSGMSVGQLASIEGMRLFELASHMLDMQPAEIAPRKPAHVVVLLGTPQHIAMARAATRLLADAGMRVTLLAVADSASTRWWADPTYSWSSQIEIFAIMTPDANDLPAADLIIDLLQSWRKAAAQAGSIAEVIQLINTAGRPVLSLDLPSGTVFDERGLQRSGVRATATLATLLPLRELSFVAAAPLLGEVWLGDLGLSPRFCKRVGVRVGPLFESASLVRLDRVPLGDGTISSDISRWVIADI
jgi:NAD(P)H-hydrate repair Nnr-like enzyme with NAD(P)H-hydrate epimerase domain